MECDTIVYLDGMIGARRVDEKWLDGSEAVRDEQNELINKKKTYDLSGLCMEVDTIVPFDGIIGQGESIWSGYNRADGHRVTNLYQK
jgi:hypothetical protein